MIIELTIQNFRSIKDEYTFSLFSENNSEYLKENVAYPGDRKYGVLRTAGIYGANASGKSNVLKAFRALRYLIVSTGELKDGEPIKCYEPYLLSRSTLNAPTYFQIEFYHSDGLRYIYSVSYNKYEIITESLDYYPSRSKANLFRKEECDEWDDISFGSHLKGGKKKYPLFKNNSYLSKSGNSADSAGVLREIYNFFNHELMVMGINEVSGTLGWKDNLEITNKIAKILSNVDTGIVGLDFKDDDRFAKNFRFPDDFPESIKKKLIEEHSKKAVFSHLDEDFNSVGFDEEDESSGTMKLYNMLPLLIETLRDGGVLLFDELDNSFHVYLAELILRIFNNPEINTKNAQLIFTTHNITLMSPSIFRRDQIWLTKKVNGATELTSLEEFDKSVVKIDSPFSKWYNEGRFSATPEIDFNAISEILCKGK